MVSATFALHSFALVGPDLRAGREHALAQPLVTRFAPYLLLPAVEARELLDVGELRLPCNIVWFV